jgi:serine/threonine protein kinase
MNHRTTDLAPGTRIDGRYRVIAKLGDGGMASVYEADDALLGRRVAIKVLHREVAAIPAWAARFLREAKAAAKIRSPHVARVTDYGTLEDRRPFLALELLSGRDWASDIAREGPQSIEKCARIVTRIARALGVLHAQGVVHRDLKPENIRLVEHEGDPLFPKILDFGLSKLRDVLKSGASESSLTETGVVMGTPHYMSPEQCTDSSRVDHRTDIYALGVILYRALTGQYPHDGASAMTVMLAIVSDRPPRASAHRAALPEELVSLIDRMLAHDPSARPNVAEIEAALRPFTGEAPRVRAMTLVLPLVALCAGASAMWIALTLAHGGGALW